ncbi:MAG: ABC transporter ATP-binding protein [Gammaproteobacteria bacterium]|nr:ABC transporter ATP-binding protein [Gammaproteobacteria bacterium]
MIIRTHELTRTYHHGTSIIPAVNKVSVRIADASFVSLLGPSGSGKTTLLNLIGLIDSPTSGTIYFDDQDVSHLKSKEQRRLRLENIGFVFQTFNLLPTLTALENVEFPLAMTKLSQDAQRTRAKQLLTKVGLTHRLHHRPGKLSTGEMQRVAIARALANNPRLILADEPTGDLDTDTGTEIIQLLFNLSRKQKTTVIVATHDKRVAEIPDVTYFIQDGTLSHLTGTSDD